MEAQTRTLDLRAGRRTTLRFDTATWRAIETLAAGEAIRWTEWVRRLVAANSGAENMHAVIRRAAVEGLLAEATLAQRAEQMVLPGATLLAGCSMLADAQFDQELSAGQVEGAPLELVAFQLLAGLDQHNQPTIWIRNGLREGLHVAITLPFSAGEVAAKHGAFE